MTKLEEICARKSNHVAIMQMQAPHGMLMELAQEAPPPRGFYEALKRRRDGGEIGLIAEIKKASPSRGVIRADFDVEALAKAYEAGGATCVSVLTDVDFFQGHDQNLIAARAACSLPILRKDFIIDSYQIAESRALGADCILLIMAALDDPLAHALEDEAMGLGMDVLIEVHDERELKRAFAMESPLIGINNRHLGTMEVDIGTSLKLAGKIPPNRLMVSESGLFTRSDLLTLAEKGVSAFLIGEALMREEDVQAAVKSLLEDN